MHGFNLKPFIDASMATIESWDFSEVLKALTAPRSTFHLWALILPLKVSDIKLAVLFYFFPWALMVFRF